MPKVRKFVPGVSGRECIIPKKASFGDQRYRYKNWRCLSSDEKSTVRWKYPHKSSGIPDGAYAYPIKADGSLANARRTLVWSYAYTKRKVAR